MWAMMHRVFAVLMVLAVLPALRAEPPDNRNGATWYGRALENFPSVTDEEWELVNRYRAHSAGVPPVELRRILARFDRAMGHARRGARQKYSDYQLDYSQGFDLMLPHLTRMRTLARVMQADALVKLHDGDAGAAADRIASMYRMGSHMGEDRIVISSLVGQIVWKAGDQALQTMLDRGALGPAEAAVALRAAESMPSIDPFNYVDATIMEFDLVVSTIENQVDADGFVDLDMLGDFDEREPAENSVMTVEEVREHFDLYGEYIDEVVEILVEADPDRGPQDLEALTQRLADGEFGQIAGRFAPKMNKVFDRKLAVERRLARRMETLKSLVAGEHGVREHANAAFWYLRAAEALHRKPEAHLAALRSASPAPGRPVRPEIVSLLDECDDVRTLLRDASEMSRCDFTVIRDPAAAPALAPRYAVGLRDLLRLIIADSRHRRDAGDRDALMDRLRIAWSMVKHFESDPMFTTVLTNHEAFNRLVPLTVHAVQSELLTAEQHAELSSLAHRLRRTDPFGYAAATVQARADIARYFKHSIVFIDVASPAERYAKLTQTVRNFDARLLLYLAAVIDTRRHADDADFDAYRSSCAPLAGVLDLAMLSQARADASQLLPLTSPEIEGLADRPIPDIGSIDRRRSRARRELRRGLEALRPRPPDAEKPADP